ncbi:MAG: helix-turn-helix transcriptional regulator [Spirochaetales bacterium]|jgi:transcriptional regulator with XRE-family HTH domain|nr:helix-turn-helix transcriptional regulator [Spirochaetales bacterium]
MANVKEYLAANLISSRTRLGFSQKQLSRLSGLSLACIKQLEAGEKFPNAKVFERLSEALGCKPYEFLFEGDEQENYDSMDNLAYLHIILTEKINDLLEQTVRRRLEL